MADLLVIAVLLFIFASVYFMIKYFVNLIRRREFKHGYRQNIRLQRPGMFLHK